MITDAALVTIRTSSKRLPNKTLKKIRKDIRSIDIILERAKKTNFFVILTTSTNPSDDILVNIAQEHNVSIFRGSLNNKIKRWHDCLKKFGIKNALIVDGDDLCFDYDIGLRAIHELKKSSSDLVRSPRNIVPGFFTYAMTENAINKLYSVVPLDSTDTGIIDKYTMKANLKSSFVSLKNHEINKNLRLTLDYEEDLEFFRTLYEHIDILSNGETIIKFLNANKSIVQINLFRHKDFMENQRKFNEEIQ